MKFLHKERFQTLLPYWIILIVLEAVAYFSWVGPYISRTKIAFACISALIFLFLLDCIPPIHFFLNHMKESAIIWIKNLPKHRWKRFFFIIFGSIFGAFIIERIINHALSFNWRVMIWLSAILFILCLFVFFRDLLITKVEVIVFLIIMTIGTVFTTTLPVSCGICWDDETHFANSLMLSHILDARITAGDKYILDNFVPVALEHTIYTLDSHEEWIETLDTIDATEDYVGFARLKPIPKNLCYAPAAFGLMVGRALHLPYHIIFIFGKFCNLLTYALLTYFAIKRLKTGKMIVSTIGMLPPIIFMASSYSRDAWMIGWVTLGISYIIAEFQEPDKPIKLQNMVIMFISFIVGITPKAIYFPLMLLCIFIPASKFKDKKFHRLFIFAFLIASLAILASFALPYISTGGSNSGDSRMGETINSGSQTSYILEEPLNYTCILFRFLTEYFSLSQANTYINYMHYFGTASFAVLSILLLIFVAITDRGEEDIYIPWHFKASALLTSFVCVVLSATAMYISCTPYQYDSILGCQYRYLFQIYFPVLFVLGGFRFENKLIKNYSYHKRLPQNWYRCIILALSSFILLFGLWELCIAGFR